MGDEELKSRKSYDPVQRATTAKLLGSYLQDVRQSRKLDIDTAARYLGITNNELAGLEAGLYSFSGMTLFWNRVANVYDLSQDEEIQLRQFATDPQDQPLAIAGDLGSVAVSPLYPTVVDELRNQFKDFQRGLADLGNRIEQAQLQKPDATPMTLMQDVQSLKQSLAQIEHTSDVLTAPVRIPARQAMEVTLVPSTYLARLEEYRSEESLWFSVFGIFFGSVIGIFVNVATGGVLRSEARILVATFVMMAILTGAVALQARHRGNRLKEQLLKPHAPEATLPSGPPAKMGK